MFYKTGIDITNDRQMFEFLKNHFEYWTANSWNRLGSIANNVKMYNLKLTGDWSVAYDLLASGEYETINFMIEDWCREHPGYMVISYVNTSAAVKALTDVVVTSSNALKIVKQLPEDKPILFGPDQNLGGYINRMTGRKMDLWNGGCHVHARFSEEALLALKEQYPNAPVLAHPECKANILQHADVIGSTQALLNYAISHSSSERPISNSEASHIRYIIATESGILHEMQKACPEAHFIPVPAEIDNTTPSYTTLHNSTQSKCNECEYMRMCTLQNLRDCLLNESNKVMVDEAVAKDAIRPIQRMLEMS